MYKGSPATVDLATRRVAICGQCPHMEETNRVVSKTVKALDGTHSGFFDYKCGMCGCIIPAKASDPGSQCPDGRWAKEGEDA